MREVPFAVVVRVADPKAKREAVEQYVKKQLGPSCPPVLVFGPEDDVDLLTLDTEDYQGEDWKQA